MCCAANHQSNAPYARTDENTYLIILQVQARRQARRIRLHLLELGMPECLAEQEYARVVAQVRVTSSVARVRVSNQALGDDGEGEQAHGPQSTTLLPNM